MKYLLLSVSNVIVYVKSIDCQLNKALNPAYETVMYNLYSFVFCLSNFIYNNKISILF